MEIVLCCGRRGGCPVLKKTDYGWHISDDFGGEVNLKEDELEELCKAVVK